MSTTWQVGGFVGMAVLLLIASYRLEEWIPRIGVLSQAFFIGSTLHLPFLVTKVHLILNGLVGVILGRHTRWRLRSACCSKPCSSGMERSRPSD